VWKGIRARGGSAALLIGGRWGNVRELLRDLGIAALFWGAFGATAWCIHGLLGEGHEKSVDILLPQTGGYVQRQFLALSQPTWVAIVLQGLVFGAMHAYQGWRAVVTISILGMMFGALAAWRKALRVGMMAHGWQDVWAGWLSHLPMVRFG